MAPATKQGETHSTAADSRIPAPWLGPKPSVLVFDVNETLIDVESMTPLFRRVFGNEAVLREWFGQLVLYSMTLTLSGLYNDYLSLAQGVFAMVGAIHGVDVKPADLEALKQSMLSMPAHADVEIGLKQLKDAGFRMVTLTNSPPGKGQPTPLENAALAGFFERQFSVEMARAYKPAQILYHRVAQELEVPSSACCMIAAHVWDTIGAQSAGLAAALVTRSGNAPLPVPGLPQPGVVAPDLPALAAQMIKLWRS
ncbi:MAG TPA: haloacid dehalogenase type II [Pirellulales bacterium]|jgi:2-haloacid dehalogenase|nr:haloacid dehalogenase type II [Pirellulales bacterium]